MATTRTRRTYDHRFQQLVKETGDSRLAIDCGVPRSTARDWSRSSRGEVFTLDLVERSTLELEREVALLRKRNEKLVAVLRLLVVLTRVLGITLAKLRVPDSSGKERILRAVERSRSSLSLRVALRILGLSSSRYHSWRREEACSLEDVSSCPRSHPHQITTAELQVVKQMATSEDYRHVPTGNLAVLAQRLGKVFASSATWYRVVRLHRLRRPRRRVHPPKPKVGIRASTANEVWHIDTTLVKLFDGTRAYLHAVLDNFSRRVLAWRVSERFDPGNTFAILIEAARNMAPTQTPPTLLSDAGVENVNAKIDDLIDSGVLRRVLAQAEIAFSNSMIESWWRSLKHQWLYLNTLDNISSLQKLVSFYVEEHNTRLPHSAFQGETPDEMYFGTGGHVPEELAARRKAARTARLEANRAAFCTTCKHAREAS
jgi:transposase InsO family protein